MLVKVLTLYPVGKTWEVISLALHMGGGGRHSCVLQNSEY